MNTPDYNLAEQLEQAVLEAIQDDRMKKAFPVGIVRLLYILATILVWLVLSIPYGGSIRFLSMTAGVLCVIGVAMCYSLWRVEKILERLVDE